MTHTLTRCFTDLKVQQDELITRSLERDDLEGREERPEHLPPVSNGGGVDKVDKVKQDRVAGDEAPPASGRDGDRWVGGGNTNIVIGQY